MARKKNAGIWIPDEVVQDGSLGLKEKLVLSVLLNLDRESGCMARNEYILERLPDISERTLRKVLALLESKNYIEIQNKLGRYRVITVLYGKDCTSARQGLPFYPAETAPLPGKDCTSTRQDTPFCPAETAPLPGKNGTSTRQNPSFYPAETVPLPGKDCTSTRQNPSFYPAETVPLPGKNGTSTRQALQNLPLYKKKDDIKEQIKEEGERKDPAQTSAVSSRKAPPPPTLSELEAYREGTGSAVNPAGFYDYYSQRRWKGVTNWKSRIDSWGGNEYGRAEAEKKETKEKREKAQADDDLPFWM